MPGKTKVPCQFCSGTGKFSAGDGTLVQCGCQISKLPWRLGVLERGLGRRSYAALDADGVLVSDLGTHQLNAMLIVDAVNTMHKPPRVGRRRRTVST
jgi:hypothetical protein